MSTSHLKTLSVIASSFIAGAASFGVYEKMAERHNDQAATAEMQQLAIDGAGEAAYKKNAEPGDSFYVIKEKALTKAWPTVSKQDLFRAAYVRIGVPPVGEYDDAVAVIKVGGQEIVRQELTGKVEWEAKDGYLIAPKAPGSGNHYEGKPYNLNSLIRLAPVY